MEHEAINSTGHLIIQVVGGTFGLLLIAAAVQALSKRIKIPFTVALVVVGILLAQFGHLAGAALGPILSMELPPEAVFFIFLPALVFESAFNMETRALKENLAPVLTLAIPGLLISTVLIGGFMVLAVGMSWPVALLLGSMLSATDPVGVIALFRQLGAPKRLTVLVEGESLFNDATSIVAARIIQTVMLAGVVTTAGVMQGIMNFIMVFFGGLVVGWVFALLVGQLMGRVEGDAFIEITLTAVLAYFAFILGEEVFHLSGVMATVAAGMVIGGWGKTKISPSVAHQLEHFWEYLAEVANALVFLMVGLMVDLGALMENWHILLLAILAMVVSRAVVVYSLVPLVGRIPGTDPIDRGYQTVMFWGGLRGAIALAIALQLPEFPERDLLVAIVMGAVLFTLLLPGLTMEKVVKAFGLNEPPLSDRLARIEGLISAKRRTLQQIPELQEGGLFSPRIAETLQRQSTTDLERMKADLDALRDRELDLSEERRLLYLRCFAEEKSAYYDMFSKGHLSEGAYRNLAHSIELQTEGIRHEGRIPEYTLHPPTGDRMENVLFRLLDQIIGFRSMAERLRAGRTARDYEVAWARSRASGRVLGDLGDLAEADSTRPDVVEEVRAFYEYWHENARTRMDLHAEQFPEFVGAMQERLADRLALHAEREAIEEKAHAGTIPPGVADAMLEEMAMELRKLRASQISKLKVDPSELLRKVPFFKETPEEEFEKIASRLRPRTSPAGEAIIRQGDAGDSLFLVARGVIRVSREDDGQKRSLATLMAGDFFGEMALLHGEARNATCKAVTPCALYELRRPDMDALLAGSPQIKQALHEAAERRRAENVESAQER
jgi:CPA1 family monovalent cation:H+ antiporter